MAPEQWRGTGTDHRTDIYALGCVLYEMATGKRLGDEPIPHPRLEWVVRGCVAAEPDDRWQSARDVRRLLESVKTVHDAVPPGERWSWLWLAAMAIAGLAGIAAAWMLKPPAPLPPYHLSIAPPPNTALLLGRSREGGVAVSPDGRTIAFAALTAGKAQLWTRRLDSFEAQPVPGTDGAFYPFWSPDSRWIAFFTPDRLMKVAVAGGPPQMVCVTDPRSIGGAWGADDVILVASDTGNSLDRVAAVGGVLTPLTRGRWPHFLPDGRRFLFERAEGIWVGSVAAGDAPRPIVDSNARKPAYSNGHLLFARDRKLMAQRFDPGTLRVSGEAYPVAEVMFGMIDNPVEFSVTAGGLLAYANGERQTTLVWRDRTGKRLDELASSGEPGTPRISPDGRRVAFARTDGTNTDIWIADLGRRSTTRLTFDAAIDRFPVWSPDGATITYASGAASNAGLYRRAADGSGGAERLTTGPSAQHPMDWAMNNRVLSFTRNELAMGTNLMVLSAGVEHTFLRTIVSEAHSQLDPKAGRWIAYSSDDSGRREIYVMPFQPDRPAGDARWQLSTAGGTMPRWRRDGGELYYRGLDGRIMAAAVDGSGPAFKWSAPQPLFQTVAPTMRTNDIEFDVTPDGQRFLLVEPSDRAESQPLMVNTDWLATLKGTSR
jgi:Tol biopolymer transport system component